MTPHSESRSTLRQVLNATVIVGALGYFVDIFDLLLFPIVRTPSLKALGVPPEQLLEVGGRLLSWQMNGMLLGGLLWGILGDRKGRLSVLFGSIALYSLANLANAFVTSIPMYMGLRFIAGLGLAGELGAAITLVSETLPTHLRGYGTTIVASVGVTGAVVAGAVGKFFTWKIAYLVGGGLGLALLLLRIGVAESGMFKAAEATTVSRGNLFMLFTSRERFLRYLACILTGVPVWFVVGILVFNAEEFARVLGVQGVVTGGLAVAWCYGGGALGDLASGLLSQRLKSRRKAVAVFLILALIAVFIFLNLHGRSAATLYYVCMALGFTFGYWAVLVTLASEQFGTNLRSTVTTTVPNFVRGSVTPMTLVFIFLKTHFGLLNAAYLLGSAVILLALLSLAQIKESFATDLDFFEEYVL